MLEGRGSLLSEKTIITTGIRTYLLPPVLWISRSTFASRAPVARNTPNMRPGEVRL
jgi:hypothetical protein